VSGLTARASAAAKRAQRAEHVNSNRWLLRPSTLFSLTAKRLQRRYSGPYVPFRSAITARRLSRTQRGRVSAPASVGSNRWLGRRERSEPGLPAGAARRAVKPSAKRSA